MNVIKLRKGQRNISPDSWGDFKMTSLELIAPDLIDLPRELSRCQDLTYLNIVCPNLTEIDDDALWFPNLKVLKLKEMQVFSFYEFFLKIKISNQTYLILY